MAAPTARFTFLSPLFPHGFFLQWKLDGTLENGTYTFDLYRSGGAEGPWEAVAVGLTNKYAFEDRFLAPIGQDGGAAYLRPNNFAFSRVFYYRLLIKSPSGIELEAKEESGTMIDGPTRGQYAAKVRDFRRGLLYNGMPLALLKRRTWGKRCPVCYDARTKEPTRGNCSTCYGTSFEGGFWDPTYLIGRRSGVSTRTQNAPENKADAAEFKVWIPDVPGMDQNDVIVCLKDRRRLRVDTQDQSEIRTAPVHQILTTVEIPHDHIIYRFPVDASLCKPFY